MAKYYDIRDDLNKYPDAWLYLIYSKRGPGKTYSTLRYVIENNIKFIFMKRTQNDVELLCAQHGKLSDKMVDFSPFVPLNRDFGWNIKADLIDDGLAAFYNFEVNEDGKEVPVGEALAYILATTTATKYKGFDMSDCEVMIFDEFIPRPWERVNRKEGDQLLDLYLTVSRDRLKRGRNELKLICLANATSINNPVFLTMNVMDVAADMNVTGSEYHYDEYRGILMHQIDSEFDAEAGVKKSGIERAMENTQFGAMAFGGKFGYNDFSALNKAKMKNYTPRASYRYKNKNVYIYQNQEKYYLTFSSYQKAEPYNLDQENQQKKFYYDWVIDIMNENIEGNVFFEKYSMYDLIVNYKKIFNI